MYPNIDFRGLFLFAYIGIIATFAIPTAVLIWLAFHITIGWK